MVWDIRWSPTAQKQLQKIAKSNASIAQQIVEKLEGIIDDPLILTDNLHGINLRKLRVGSYLVIMRPGRAKNNRLCSRSWSQK